MTRHVSEGPITQAIPGHYEFFRQDYSSDVAFLGDMRRLEGSCRVRDYAFAKTAGEDDDLPFVAFTIDIVRSAFAGAFIRTPGPEVWTRG